MIRVPLVALGLSVALAAALGVAHAAAAPDSARVRELEAQVRELEALRDGSSDPAMRKLLEQQIGNLKQTVAMLRSMEVGGAKPQRVELNPQMKAFFTPAAPAEVPAWVQDSAVREGVTDAMMKCSQGANVYRFETNIGCAVPSDRAGGIPVRHGLDLDFYKSTGKLMSQGFYENGLLRWSIEYHATGKRSLVATFDDVEPKVHRENGVRTSYAANGTVTSQAEYRSGVLNGWHKLWEDDGHPIVGTLHENGKAVEQVLPDGTRKRL